MNKILFIFIVLLSQAGIAQIEECPVLPSPMSYQLGTGETIIDGQLAVNANGINPELLTFFSDQLSLKERIQLVADSSASALTFKQLSNVPKDFYSITFQEQNKTIQYSSEASLFYALNSLLQLIELKEGELSIKHCFLQDAPKFEWRGLHLDVSRHFYSVKEVKRFIDLMSLYKFNKFHWHLTDDQGWRIEVKKYPKLTEIGAYRDSTVIGHYSRSPRSYEVEKYGGFYTQEEAKEIVAYAKTKYVEVVPEIELPGHSRAALAAYPELSCTGERNPVPGLWGVFDDIYCSKKESIDFMKDVLAEVLEIFPSEYIHIGGDEAPKTRWKKCTDCQQVIKDNELKDEHELQSFFISQIDEYLTGEKRKLIGWDEILEGGLSKNAAVMSWRGTKGGIEAAKQNHYVVMTPTTYCYFDYYQSSHKMEPLAIGGYLPLEKVYKFNPIPSELTPAEGNYILGGQANLWTEYIPDMKQLEYMTYPRAIALAQSVWCQEKPSYEMFLSTYLKYHEAYLSAHKVNFSQSIHLPNLKVERAENGINIRFKGGEEDALFKVTTSEGKTSEVMIDGVKSANVQKETSIRYLRGEDSLYISRSEKDSELHCFVSSEKFNGNAEYKFVRHEHLGANIEMITTPHPKFNNNGSLNLVDGIIGESPWKGSEWLGFTDQEIEFIVDLGSEKSLTDLSIGFLKDNGSWIYVPETISIEVSKDAKCWKKTVKKASVNQLIEDGRMNCELSKKARYVKVVIQSMKVIPDGMDGGGHAPWTFIDEVMISSEKK